MKRFMKTTRLHHLALVLLLAAAPVARGQFTFLNVADSSSPTYSTFGVPSLNTAGTLGFLASLDAGGSGLFTGDGTTTTTIALSSGPTFSGFGMTISLNTAGTVGFRADLDAGGFGFYTSDGTTTTLVIRDGDALFGSTVTALDLGREALNDAGQFAFRYSLADGRTGVAVATLVPEPAGALLLCAGGLGLLARRRRLGGGK